MSNEKTIPLSEVKVGEAVKVVTTRWTRYGTITEITAKEVAVSDDSTDKAFNRLADEVDRVRGAQ